MTADQPGAAVRAVSQGPKTPAHGRKKKRTNPATRPRQATGGPGAVAEGCEAEKESRKFSKRSRTGEAPGER